MSSFASQILNFLKNLHLESNTLPERIEVMNPFQNQTVWTIVELFYNKYYNNNQQRKLILGINPGRHGAGLTGIPFTDTKRLNSECEIQFFEFESHETSSVFVYDMIHAYGGVTKFYNDFYISSVSPLGFVKKNNNRRFVNYNYYDNKALENALKPFIVDTLKQQIRFGIDTDICYCLGTGKNHQYLEKLNAEYGFFQQIIPLEHPRYIMQYKLKEKQKYIEKYIQLLAQE